MVDWFVYIEKFLGEKVVDYICYDDWICLLVDIDGDDWVDKVIVFVN